MQYIESHNSQKLKLYEYKSISYNQWDVLFIEHFSSISGFTIPYNFIFTKDERSKSQGQVTHPTPQR